MHLLMMRKLVINHVATGQLARSLRKASNFPLKAIAARMGRSVAYVSELELGTRKWTEELVERYIKAVADEQGPAKRRLRV